MTARTISLRNTLLVLLLAAVLALRVVVPQGWMIGENASGAITIEVCNSDQKLVIPLKDGAAGHGQDDGDMAKQPCAFSGHSAADTPPDPGGDLPLPQLAKAAYDTVRERALSPHSPRQLPPSTGPPALA